jgi:hypothetical protein
MFKAMAAKAVAVETGMVLMCGSSGMGQLYSYSSVLSCPKWGKFRNATKMPFCVFIPPR